MQNVSHFNVHLKFVKIFLDVQMVWEEHSAIRWSPVHQVSGAFEQNRIAPHVHIAIAMIKHRKRHILSPIQS